MNTKALTREEIIAALQKMLEPLPYVYAMWEAGAAAFDRVDEWSDIDLQVDVADEKVEDVARLVEETLAQLSVTDLKYALPQPTWHGHYQVFTDSRMPVHFFCWTVHYQAQQSEQIPPARDPRKCHHRIRQSPRCVVVPPRSKRT